MFEKIEKVKRFVSKFEKVILAFSGGVDSATLAAICKDVVDVLAVTIKADNIPSREIEKAKRISREIGIKHKFLDLDIFQEKNFFENSKLRCYYCKKFMIENLKSLAIDEGCNAILEGTNASDLEEDRPGYKAVVESGIAFSPWAIFGVKKDEIRSFARSLGFSFYKDPPLSCLATRIPYGKLITPKQLKMIDLAENAVIEFSKVGNVRVRCLDEFAIVEVEKDEIEKILNKKESIKSYLLNIGFKKVFVNLEGYKRGVINEDFSKFIEI